MVDLHEGQRYRHWKGGTYKIIALGFEEATGSAIVAYRSDATGVIWTRPLSNFLGMVKEKGAPSPSVRRFELIPFGGDRG